MNKTNYIKTIVLAFLVFSSCNDDILDKSNPAELPVESFFKTRNQLQAAVNAIYSGLQANNLYGREYFFLHDMLSDENSGTNGLEAPRRAALNYSLDPGNKLVVDVWQGLYRVIHRANLVIANAKNVPAIEVSEGDRNRFEGEARFLRAWAYFELVSMWGDVPLITEPGNTETTGTGTPKATANKIYDEVILTDLGFAETNLLKKSEYGDADLGRVTKGAAQALKARIQLFRGNYAEARVELVKVVESDEYELTDRYLDNFQEENENNVESIFEVQFSTAHGYGNPWSPDGNGIDEVTFRGQEYTPVTGWRNVNPTADLKAAFAPGDPRYAYTFYENGEAYNNGSAKMELTEPGWQKYSNAYKQGAENEISGINFRVIRYADVLLMMAEVENELTGPATAAPYINEVRARADVNLDPVVVPATKDEMLKLIMNERRIEFASEQIRNRDIRRWRRQGKFDTEPIANYQPERHDLLPIPSGEIDNNPALTQADQNPGY